LRQFEVSEGRRKMINEEITSWGTFSLNRVWETRCWCWYWTVWWG
jgi:hypothetical protein